MANLIETITKAIAITPGLLPYLGDEFYKTANYFQRVINTWVNDLFTGEVKESEFVDKFANLIEQQLTRAWREGMRENGLTPADMDDEMQATLTDIITKEFSFIDQFAADIASGNFSLAQLQARANIWGNRYEETVNIAKLETANLKDKLEWVLGKTEQHCQTCSELNGKVASAAEWTMSGLRPQSPKNSYLECQGWNCDCSLEPTDKRRTRNALDVLYSIASRFDGGE